MNIFMSLPFQDCLITGGRIRRLSISRGSYTDRIAVCFVRTPKRSQESLGLAIPRPGKSILDAAALPCEQNCIINMHRITVTLWIV